MRSIHMPLPVLLLIIMSLPMPSWAVPTVNTYWLENDLRVVEVGVDGATTAGIRLVVESGRLRVPAEQQHIPHLVEHVCFPEVQANPDLQGRFRRSGGVSNAHTGDFRVTHEFDLPDSLAAYVLHVMRSQWDTPFPEDLVRREAERVQHELSSTQEDTKLMNLARQVYVDWEQERNYRERGNSIHKEADHEELWRHFQEVYVGKRLTLLIAASPATLESLRPAIRQFESLPAGTAASVAQYGDVSWLHGVVDTWSPWQPNYVGMWFPRLATRDAGKCMWLHDAVGEYLDSHLAQEQPVAYGFDHELYVAEDEQIWVSEFYSDFLMDGRAEIHEAARQAYAWLASDEAQPWWQGFEQQQKALVSLWLQGADQAAAHLTDVASVTPHSEPVTNTYPWKPPAAKELQAMYRTAYGSASVFVVGLGNGEPPAGFFVDGEWSWGPDPALVRFAWWVTEYHGEYLGWALGNYMLVILLVVLLVKGRPRLDRGQRSLRLEMKA